MLLMNRSSMAGTNREGGGESSRGDAGDLWLGNPKDGSVLLFGELIKKRARMVQMIPGAVSVGLTNCVTAQNKRNV